MTPRAARRAQCAASSALLIWLFAAMSSVPASAATAAADKIADPIVEFVVLKADTLIGLSNTVLVSPGAWREVAALNKLPDANRIVPGQVLKIPARLLRGNAVNATLVGVVGDVRAGDAAAAVGTPVAEGQSVQTGPASSAVLALADGSRVRLPPSSLAQVEASRTYGDRATTAGADTRSGLFAGTMRLLRGSVEVVATKVLRAKPLEVTTPTAVVGVRGTQYRVGLDEGAEQRTHAEVIEGAVRFDRASAGAGTGAGASTGAGNAGTGLDAGFGAAVDSGPGPLAVARLLAAPDLSSLAARFERPIVRFELPSEAAPLRVQVATDSGFEQLVSDQKVPARSAVRIAGLDDATWYLRARRIDVQGIEGVDAVRSFVLKARPEPPASRAPRANAKQTVGSVEFAWAQNVEAPRVRLQVSEDEAFTRLVQDHDDITTASLRTDIATAGAYYWRTASIRASGDHGPFGDAQRFELRPTPEPPAMGRSADGNALVFTWGGRPEDRHQVQLARDPGFAEITAEAELAAAEWTLPAPSRGGRYYFRYRSVEPDGFVSPYSTTLMVDLPRDWSALGLLLPLLLVFLF